MATHGDAWRRLALACANGLTRAYGWKHSVVSSYADAMQKFRGILNIVLWAAAAAFAAFRIGKAEVFMLGAIEGLMLLIAAFVAHKTLDLVFPPDRPNADQ